MWGQMMRKVFYYTMTWFAQVGESSFEDMRSGVYENVTLVPAVVMSCLCGSLLRCCDYRHPHLTREWEILWRRRWRAQHWWAIMTGCTSSTCVCMYSNFICSNDNTFELSPFNCLLLLLPLSYPLLFSVTQAIDEAARKIEDMLKKSREEQTGINLEVNGRILDSCTDLMKAIQVLIKRSKELQQEIVSEGMVWPIRNVMHPLILHYYQRSSLCLYSSSVSQGSMVQTGEFYKKNSRWSEGLISAAKQVGWGASLLVWVHISVCSPILPLSSFSFSLWLLCSPSPLLSLCPVMRLTKLSQVRASLNNSLSLPKT